MRHCALGNSNEGIPWDRHISSSLRLASLLLFLEKGYALIRIYARDLDEALELESEFEVDMK